MDSLRFPNGTVIKGKWNKAAYRIESVLGEGANGRVYLVKKGDGLFALKIGFDPLDIQSEVNVLQKLTRSGGTFQGYLIDVDDFRHEAAVLSFYVMKYVKGERLSDYLQANGVDWFYLLGQNLLLKLTELHTQGWIFGDLKLENILVSKFGEIELIDYGGVTLKGSSVKQFTEIYDRGYWHAGSRIADAEYDLFSFAVLFLQLAAGKRWLELTRGGHLLQNRSTARLLKLLDEEHPFAAMTPFFTESLSGKYSSAAEALTSWKTHIRELGEVHYHPIKARWLNVCFVGSMLLMISAIAYWWS